MKMLLILAGLGLGLTAIAGDTAAAATKPQPKHARSAEAGLDKMLGQLGGPKSPAQKALEGVFDRLDADTDTASTEPPCLATTAPAEPQAETKPDRSSFWTFGLDDEPAATTPPAGDCPSLTDSDPSSATTTWTTDPDTTLSVTESGPAGARNTLTWKRTGKTNQLATQRRGIGNTSTIIQGD